MILLNIHIEVHFVANKNRVLKQGSFPLKGRKPEIVAFNWWKEIKRELPVDYLEKILVNGEEITKQITELDKLSPLP